MMEKLVTIFMYILWVVTLLGVLTITFTNFQYPDLNLLVGILFLFTAVNTFLTVNSRKK